MDRRRHGDHVYCSRSYLGQSTTGFCVSFRYSSVGDAFIRGDGISKGRTSESGQGFVEPIEPYYWQCQKITCVCAGISRIAWRRDQDQWHGRSLLFGRLSGYDQGEFRLISDEQRLIGILDN